MHDRTVSTSPRQLQPIIYSTLSTDGIKEIVFCDYDVDEPIECTLISRSISDTYKVSTAGQRFAFKVYRTSWRPREDIEWELNTLNHMDAHGVAVALPVPRADGTLITEVLAPEGPRSAVLFRWAFGSPPKYTAPDHAFQYGRAVAQLHNLGDELPANPSRPEIDVAYFLDGPLALIRSRLAEMPAMLPRLAALEERVRERSTRAGQRLGDWGFCHGDIWINNARIDHNRLVLFDFDFSAPGWQISDLASYRWDAHRNGVEHIAWKPFLEGYTQVRPDAARSLPYIGLFMILRHLWTAALFISRAPETGTNFLSDEALESMVPFCERLETEVG